MSHEKEVDEPDSSMPLGRWSVLNYGVGHMLNDITSSCWFTYLLVFLTDVGLSSRDAAIVMLSGQIADGFTTIFVGELIDRFGNFKVWHGAGSVLVAASFSSVFGGCLPCKIFSTRSRTVYTIGYSIFATIFNVGWAFTQVSHMAVVNCITLNSTSRVVLTSCRNAFTMVANLSLYGIAFAVFSIFKSGTVAEIEYQYSWIAYLSIFVGSGFVGIFLIGTKEPRLRCYLKGEIRPRISWIYWFKKKLYYQVAVVYVLTRLVNNVSQVFIAFYVITDLQMAQSSKALVPATSYICSFIVSVLLQEIAWTSERLKAFYSTGGILWIFCGSGVLLLPRSLSGIIYILAAVFGIANALIMVTAISMQSLLVGADLNGCAFVYGSLSFLDKFSCGLALYILESYESTSPYLEGCDSTLDCLSITRYGLGLVPAVCALLGSLVTCTMDLQPSISQPSLEPLLA